jgi:anaerobic C4-dicarboxylate transporter
MWTFVVAIVAVATLGALPSLLPLGGDKPLSMVLKIQI